MSPTVPCIRVVAATPFVNGKGGTVAAVSRAFDLPAAPGEGAVFSALRATIGCGELSVATLRPGVEVWHAADPRPGWLHNAVATDAAKMLAGLRVEINGPAVFTGAVGADDVPTSLSISDAQTVWEVLSAAANTQWNT